MKRFIAVVALTLVPVVALAESVKEKKAWDAITEASKKLAATTKEKCGAEVHVMPDRKSFDTVELAERPALWCITEAESWIPAMCDDADYKAAIASIFASTSTSPPYNPAISSQWKRRRRSLAGSVGTSFIAF